MLTHHCAQRSCSQEHDAAAGFVVVGGVWDRNSGVLFANSKLAAEECEVLVTTAAAQHSIE